MRQLLRLAPIALMIGLVVPAMVPSIAAASPVDQKRQRVEDIVDELERRDLILREKVPTDRRAYALVPTLAGRQLCAQAVAAVRKHEERLFADMAPGAVEDMVALLRRIQTRGAEE